MEFVKLVGPFGTIFIMFALGLNLNINDFLKVIKRPNNLIVGLISQLIVEHVVMKLISVSFFYVLLMSMMMIPRARQAILTNSPR